MLGSFPTSILPEVTFPRVVVIAEAGDRPVRMIEVGVSRPLEGPIATVPGVARIRSQMQHAGQRRSSRLQLGNRRAGSAAVGDRKTNEVRQQIPPETQISVERMNRPYSRFGPFLARKNLTQAELWNLPPIPCVPRLARVPGVARVVVQGGTRAGDRGDVDPRRLAAFKLSLLDVNRR